MPDIIRQRPNVRLKILGVGPYEAELRALVAQMALEQVVEITHVPSADRTGMARELLSAQLVDAVQRVRSASGRGYGSRRDGLLYSGRGYQRLE